MLFANIDEIIDGTPEEKPQPNADHILTTSKRYIERPSLMGKLTSSETQSAVREMDGSQAYSFFLALVNSEPAAVATPVIFCRQCAAHNRCAAEQNFLSEGIAEPFCCRGRVGDGTP